MIGSNIFLYSRVFHQVRRRLSYFLSSAALVVMAPHLAWAQEIDCTEGYDILPAECVQANAGLVVDTEATPNTEFEAKPVTNNSGFVFSIDGTSVNADPRVIGPIRQADIALARADIRVSFDGLNVKPRLDLEYAELGRNRYELQSRLNYPGFVSRAEMRIIDLDALGGPRLVQTLAIEPNGVTNVDLPNNNQYAVVHRVYDSQGRYDETHPIALAGADPRGLVAGVEDGTDNAAIRRIPVHGGAVTVSSNNVAPGSVVATLGEVVRPTADGSFVIQRILAPGAHDIAVVVNGPLAQDFSRRVDIPNAEWFYTAIIDATVGMRLGDEIADEDRVYTRGRVAGYVDGKFANGTTVTASIDTQEEALSDLFRNLDQKDPRNVIARVDPYSVYRVFGDDSSAVDNTPTAGRIYLKIERENNFFLWGDYKNVIIGNAFVRNDRSLYGAQAQLVSRDLTRAGEPRIKVQAYAAQPDTAAGRDVFRGTGGSVYFLRQQDINYGSTNLAVEVRDRATNRLVERRPLVEGVDYTINHLQGSIVLRNPLTGREDSGLIAFDPSGDSYVNLVANYEYTPTLSDVNTFAYGARAETWVSDNIRVGASALSEQTDGQDDQIVYGADVLVEFGQDSSLRADYAKSKGPGFASSYSTDGGLIVDTVAASAGTGEAFGTEANIALGDIGLRMPGYVSGYYQRRQQGFSTQDYHVGADTGDETLWGLATELEISPLITAHLGYDHYENQADDYTNTAKASLDYAINDRLSASLGLSHIEKSSAGETGQRTDLAGRIEYVHSDQLTIYGFAQGAISKDRLAENNRAGIGATYKINDRWDITGEVYGSNAGAGGKALINYQADDASSLYFGYERDPSRNIALSEHGGDDWGRFTIGGTQRVSDRVSYYSETRYDLFSEGLSLTGAYGVNYQVNEYLRHELSVEGGRVVDPVNGDLNRLAISLGSFYEDDRLSIRSRAEYRQDRGTTNGTSRDADVYILDLSGRYKYSEAARLGFGLSYYDTNTDQSSVLDGRVIDGNLSYAYRPIDNDKLNFLFGYRYYHDMYGQRIDGDDVNRIRQKSHVASADGIYEYDDQWEFGAKIGARLAETSASQTVPFVENNAWLGVLNARYHIVHNWDILAEGRVLQTFPYGSRDYGLLIAAYHHFGNNLKLGIGYNFGSFSDDLTDLTYDDQGAFINLIGKF